MKVGATAFLAASVLMAGLSVAPASAQSLLGGLLGGDGGGDSSTVGSVADVGSGPAGNSAFANVGLGSGSGDDNNVADVNIGRSGLLDGSLLGGGLLGGNNDQTVANLNISGGGEGGVLGSGSAGSNLTAGIDLGGLGLDLGLPGVTGLLGSGGNGGNGGPGGNGIGGNGGRQLVGSIDGSFQVNCSVNDGRKVLQLASQARLRPGAWGRAANVQVVPVRLCPQARAQVARIFDASGKIQQLQSAAAGDALITASLSRTRYDVNDVFAVQASGGNLVVYVY
jgi:hypothetical protein